MFSRDAKSAERSATAPEFPRFAPRDYLTADDVDTAWDVFERFDDKDWGFTDCNSKVVIENAKIATAFTFDYHFRQSAPWRSYHE
jgi:predicted nucleic acid-binding protein